MELTWPSPRAGEDRDDPADGFARQRRDVFAEVNGEIGLAIAWSAATAAPGTAAQ